VLTRSARSTGPQQRARQAGAETHGPAELCPRTHTHLRSCRRTQSLAVTADCALYIWVNVRQGTGWCRCWCHDNCWAGCVGRCQWLLEELRAGLRHGDARAAGRGLPYLKIPADLVKQVVEACGWRAEGELGEGLVRPMGGRRTSGETYDHGDRAALVSAKSKENEVL
jgi:hypothetical protein